MILIMLKQILLNLNPNHLLLSLIKMNLYLKAAMNVTKMNAQQHPDLMNMNVFGQMMIVKEMLVDALLNLINRMMKIFQIFLMLKELIMLILNPKVKMELENSKKLMLFKHILQKCLILIMNKILLKSPHKNIVRKHLNMILYY